jgi:hypothetical protein
LALIGREGLTGMIGVDKIGDIRRAYFEERRPIKEIVRTLSVSRATVRKVIRGHETEFKYERGIQPTPQAGRLGRGSDGGFGEGRQPAEAGAPLDAASVRGAARTRL